MKDQNLVRGLVLMAIALAFGLQAFQYSVGTLARAGAGLFPLLVSGLLLLVGLTTVVRSRFVERVPLDFQARNIAIILGSLCVFALASRFVNMTVGIALMVFCAGFAASSWSVVRNLQIAAGLIAIAFAFQKLLGLNLPLL